MQCWVADRKGCLLPMIERCQSTLLERGRGSSLKTNRARTAPKARGHTQLTTLRCQASSNLCMMVYVLAGLHTTKVAVDFMLGSGWRLKISCKNPEITKTLEGEVEDALGRASPMYS